MKSPCWNVSKVCSSVSLALYSLLGHLRCPQALLCPETQRVRKKNVLSASLLPLWGGSGWHPGGPLKGHGGHAVHLWGAWTTTPGNLGSFIILQQKKRWERRLKMTLSSNTAGQSHPTSSSALPRLRWKATHWRKIYPATPGAVFHRLWQPGSQKRQWDLSY